GPPRPVQHPPPGDGPRDAHRQHGPQGRLPPRDPDHDDERRRPGDGRGGDRLRDAVEPRERQEGPRASLQPRVPEPSRRGRAVRAAHAGSRRAGGRQVRDRARRPARRPSRHHPADACRAPLARRAWLRRRLRGPADGAPHPDRDQARTGGRDALRAAPRRRAGRGRRGRGGAHVPLRAAQGAAGAGRVGLSRPRAARGDILALRPPRWLLVAVGVVAPAFARADTIVGLRGRDDARLTRLLARQTDPASADFGHWLTREEFAARFGASARSVRRVSRWLRAAGCVGVQRARGRQLLRCRHGRVGAPPPGIAKLVDGVFDTAGFTVTRDRLAPEPASRGAAGQFYFSPAEFARTYGLDRGHAAALDGRGITIGLLAASQINVDDITAFRTLFGLPPADVVQ